jgi:transposase
VWAYPGPVDLRKGYDGLSAIVVGTLQKNVLSGDCFLFTNRTRDQITFSIPFGESHHPLHVASASRQNRARDATGEKRRRRVCAH